MTRPVCVVLASVIMLQRNVFQEKILDEAKFSMALKQNIAQNTKFAVEGVLLPKAGGGLGKSDIFAKTT